jgi:hypothetical protein
VAAGSPDDRGPGLGGGCLFSPNPPEPPTVKLLGVTANQFVKTGLIAVVFIILFKLLAEKTKVAGLQSLASKV